MGFYIEADSKTEAIKKARKMKPKDKVVVMVSALRHRGLYYATTRFKKGAFLR